MKTPGLPTVDLSDTADGQARRWIALGLASLLLATTPGLASAMPTDLESDPTPAPTPLPATPDSGTPSQIRGAVRSLAPHTPLLQIGEDSTSALPDAVWTSAPTHRSTVQTSLGDGQDPAAVTKSLARKLARLADAHQPAKRAPALATVADEVQLRALAAHAIHTAREHAPDAFASVADQADSGSASQPDSAGTCPDETVGPGWIDLPLPLVPEEACTGPDLCEQDPLGLGRTCGSCSNLGPECTPVAGIVLGAAYAVVTGLANVVWQEGAAQRDEGEEGIGDVYERTWNTAQPLLDPDDDAATVVTEYQWNTIPAPIPDQPNVRDRDGDAWIDGHEIAYWSNVLASVFENRTRTGEPTVQASTNPQALEPSPPPARTETGLGSKAVQAIPALPSPRPDPHRSDGPEEAEPHAPIGTRADTVVSDPYPQANQARPHLGEYSWYQLVADLNEDTPYAWRHPGFFLDTDGDGYINVHDPDGDDDGLLDGHTTKFHEYSKRFRCYADSDAEKCKPYHATDLYHETPRRDVHRHPGEITLGTYPEFTDSDCQATWPDDETPRRCSPSHERGTKGAPGRGDAVNDTPEYAYWSGLTEDPNYTARYPGVDEPWTIGYDGDPVDGALLDADSDGDGLLDGEETRGCRIVDGGCRGTYARTAAWTRDTDGDGLGDDVETQHEDIEAQTDTSPTDWDTDEDRLPDGWETWYGLNASNAGDGTQDPDSDGLSNREEYCGTRRTPCEYHERANWCGPNPKTTDTDGDGTPDDEQARSYDCTPPSHIAGPVPREDPPHDDPNRDLGTLDTQSEHWLETGQLAEKAAAEPANFTERTLSDPEAVANEIHEAATRDAGTIQRLVEPPVAGYQAWKAQRTVGSQVEELFACPAPVEVPEDPTDPPELEPSKAKRDAEQHVGHPPGVAVESDKIGEAEGPSEPQALADTRASARCMSDVLQHTVDSTRAVEPDPLSTEPADYANKLSKNASKPLVQAPGPADLETPTPPNATNTTIPEPTLETQRADPGTFEDEHVDPVTREPWSLVNEPDAFPNLLADAAANDRIPSRAHEQIADVDEALGEETHLVATAESTTWDLRIKFEDRTTRQVQNIPIGTPRTVNFDEDCLGETPNLEPTTDCAEAQLEPDLVVRLAPVEASGGYRFEGETLTEEARRIQLTALAQLPNRDRAMAVGLDGRNRTVTLANDSLDPLPHEFSYTIQANETGQEREIAARLDQTGANGSLVATAGVFAVDPHEETKQPQPHPRTEFSAYLEETPENVELVTTHRDGTDRDQISASWQASKPTRVVAGLDHATQRTRAGGVLELDALPPEGTIDVSRTDGSTRIGIDTDDPEVLDRVHMQGWIDRQDSDHEPTLLSLDVTDPPAHGELLVDEDPARADERIRYEASSAFQRAEATVYPAGSKCTYRHADNVVAVDGTCTHLALTGLERADVQVTDGGLTADWQRSTTEGNLSIRIERPDATIDGMLERWPARGHLDTAWPKPTTASWDTSQAIGHFTARIEKTDGTMGLLDLNDIPETGSLEIDTTNHAVDADLPRRIGHAEAYVATNGELPTAPSGDHVVVKRTAGELAARLDLHGLGDSSARFATNETELDLRTSQGRTLTVHADTTESQVRARVEDMPEHLDANLQDTGDNTTIDLSRTGSDPTSLSAVGQLDGLGFDLDVPRLPSRLEGFVDAETGNLELDASDPLSLDATFAQNPGDPPRLIPLATTDSGVTLTRSATREDLHPGARLAFEAIEHASIRRADTDGGLDQIVAKIQASEPAPLAIASIDENTTHYASIHDVPADATFETTFNDEGNRFEYEASHRIDKLRATTDAPNAFFHAWAREVPRHVNATWSANTSELAATLNHSSSQPIPDVGFKWIDDTDGEHRSARAIAARGVSSPLDVTLEDGRNLTADLGATDGLDHVAALYADDVSSQNVTIPDNGTHGVHYRNIDDAGRSLGLRFHGLNSIEDAQIPTREDPSFHVDTGLGEAAPFELYVDDQPSSTLAKLTLEQLGGGPITVDGSLAATNASPQLELDAKLPSPISRASFQYENPDAWYTGEATTDASRLRATVTQSRFDVEANQPVDVELKGAPAGEQAPSRADTEHFAKLDVRPANPLVHADVEGVRAFNFAPDRPERSLLEWDAERANGFQASYYGPEWTIRNLTATPLARQGTLHWDTDSGLAADFQLSQGLERVGFNLTHDDGSQPTQATATVRNVSGTGSITLDPNQRARILLPGGLDQLTAEVFRNTSEELDLQQLDERLGLVFDDPNAADYDEAFAINLTHPETLDATIQPAGERGLLVDGTFELSEPIDEPLLLRANVPEGFVNATASNLPRKTDFHVDTRDAPGSDTQAHVALDWPTGTVGEATGSFRTYAQPSEDERSSPEDLRGNFTARSVENITVALNGRFEGTLTGHVGADLERGYVRIEDGTPNDTRRIRTALTGSPQLGESVYDVALEDEGRSGEIALRDGDPPLDAIRIESKNADDTTQRPNGTPLAETPQWLIASPGADSSDRYVHARIEDPTRLAWDRDGETGLDASIHRQGPGQRTYVRYENGTHHVNATIADLPNTTELTLRDGDPKTIGFETSDPIDVPLVSYRNTTNEEDGIPAQDGTDVNLQFTGRSLDGLDDTTLTLKGLDEGEAVADVSTDGLEHARLFGVFRGPHARSGEAKHLFAELEGVPETEATIEHHASHRPGQAPYVAVDSEEAIQRASVSMISPVEREPSAITYPDPPSPEYVNLHTERSPDKTENERLKVQANLTHVESATVDPEATVEGCGECESMTVTLDRSVRHKPLFVNLNASTLPVNGTVLANDTPKSMRISFGSANRTTDSGEEGSEGPNPAEESSLSDVVVDYHGDDPLRNTEVNLTVQHDDEPVRIEGTIGQFPENARVQYEREARTAQEPVHPCGFDFAEKLPGRIEVTTSGSDIEGVDLTMAPADTEQVLAPPDGVQTYAGLQTGDDTPHARMLIPKASSLALSADPTAEPTGALKASLDIDGTYQLTADVVAEAEDPNQRDQTVRFNSSTPDGPLTIECKGQQISTHIQEPANGNGDRMLDHLHVTGSGIEMLDRPTQAFELEMLDLENGLRVDLSPPRVQASDPVRGLVVDGPLGASIEDIELTANFPADETRECFGPDGEPATEAPPDLVVDWRVPVALADFALTTNPEPSNVPQTPNWFLHRDTCDEFTVAGELRGIEDVNATVQQDLDGTVTDVHANATARHPTVARIEQPEDDEISTTRAEVRDLPSQTWIHVPKSPFSSRFEISDTVELLEVARDDCVLVEMEGIEPDRGDVITTDGPWGFAETGARTTQCTLEDGAEDAVDWAVENVIGGYEEAERISLTLTDGAQRSADAVWTNVESDLEWGLDLDGWSKRRDLPRFSRLVGEFATMDVEASSQGEEERGVQWTWDGPRISVDAQPDWHDRGRGSPSRVDVRGSVDVPEGWFDAERDCVDQAADGNCVRYENRSKVARDVAGTYLDDLFRFWENRGEDETVPARTWAEVIE